MIFVQLSTTPLCRRLKVILTKWHGLIKIAPKAYRPEHHYMRGRVQSGGSQFVRFVPHLSAFDIAMRALLKVSFSMRVTCRGCSKKLSWKLSQSLRRIVESRCPYQFLAIDGQLCAVIGSLPHSYMTYWLHFLPLGKMAACFRSNCRTGCSCT